MPSNTMPLHAAITTKNAKIVKKLAELGADVLVKSDVGVNAWQCYIAGKTLPRTKAIYELDDVGKALEGALYSKMYSTIHDNGESQRQSFEELINLKGFDWTGQLRGYNIIRHLIVAKKFEYLDLALEKFTKIQASNMLVAKDQHDSTALDAIGNDMPETTIQTIIELHHNMGELLLVSAIKHDDVKLVELVLKHKPSVSDKAKAEIRNICDDGDSELSDAMPKIKNLLEKAGYYIEQNQLSPKVLEDAIYQALAHSPYTHKKTVKINSQNIDEMQTIIDPCSIVKRSDKMPLDAVPSGYYSSEVEHCMSLQSDVKMSGAYNETEV